MLRQTYRPRHCVLVILMMLGSNIQAADTIEWPYYGGTPGGGRYTEAKQINRDNVSKLAEAWRHRTEDFRGEVMDLTNSDEYSTEAARPSSFIVTPIMVQNTVYYCTPFNRVFALDPATGKELWVFDPKVDMTDEFLTNCRGVSSWIDPSTNKGDTCWHQIFMGTLDGRLIALDGSTGKKCSNFGKDGEVDLAEGLTEFTPMEYNISSAPAIIGDLIITGSYVFDGLRDDVPSGVVRAYNIRTGDFVWGWNPVHPDRPEKDAAGKYVAGTTNVWSTISIDKKRNLVIVPTGNSSPDFYGGDRDGHLDYYSSSVVALDADTGKVNWRYQTVHHDLWDFDAPSQPTFVDLNIDGTMQEAVVQLTKMGLTFVLDRDTGKPLYPVTERPAPQTGSVPGEYLSPTQPIPDIHAPLHKLGITPEDAWGLTFWDKGQCRKKIEAMEYGAIYTPPSLKGTAMYPAPIGGPNWGSPAVDPNRKIMVASVSHVPIKVSLIKRENCPENPSFDQKGSPYCGKIEPILSPLGVPCTAPPWATLAAIDLESGEKLWQVPFGTLKGLAPWPVYHFIKGGIQMGGPMVTASGLVFIGAASDAYIRAHDIMTGDELWKSKLPTSANAVPMSYNYKGEQYVLIASGGHFTSPVPPDATIVAYKLKP